MSIHMTTYLFSHAVETERDGDTEVEVSLDTDRQSLAPTHTHTHTSPWQAVACHVPFNIETVLHSLLKYY